MLAKPEAQRCLTPISRATFSIGIVRQGLTLMAGAEAKIEVRCAQGCGAVCWHTGEGAFLLRTMALRPGSSWLSVLEVPHLRMSWTTKMQKSKA